MSEAVKAVAKKVFRYPSRNFEKLAKKLRGIAPLHRNVKNSGEWKNPKYTILRGFHTNKDESGNPFNGYAATPAAHRLGESLGFTRADVKSDHTLSRAFYRAFLYCGLSEDMDSGTIVGNMTKFDREKDYSDSIGNLASEAIEYFRKVFDVALEEERYIAAQERERRLAILAEKQKQAESASK